MTAKEQALRGRVRPTPPRWTNSAIVIAVIASIAAGCGSSGDSSVPAPSASSLAPVNGTYSPSIDPADFVATIDNPYFPLKPGTGFHYKGVSENGTTPQSDDMLVTSRTKEIMGVTSTVVRDTVSLTGRPIERTLDWYAQDRYGNVWYMGEDTRELHNGRFIKMDDSWEGGVNGAQPGIIMPGDPQPGEEYRQEYYPGHALDQARVLGPGGPLRVPFGAYGHTLETVETSPRIDPGVAEHKYYVTGLGDIKEQTVSGDHEQIQPITVTH